MRRTLTRLGTREVDLMDLTQEVFLTAYLKLPELDGRSLVSTWLWAICRTVSRDHRSGPMSYEVTTDPVELEAILAPHTVSSTEPDATRHVEQLLRKLSGVQRVVFSLSEMDDMDGLQIARLLNISVGTVRSRLRCARQRLRREVERRTRADAFQQSVAR